MKKTFLLSIIVSLISFTGQTQSVTDLFTKSETKIYWLGIDFSHVKLIGDFTQFAEAGTVATTTIKAKYFTGWNDLILKEKEKYDIGGMMRKENIIFSIDGIAKINATTATEEMEADLSPNYAKEDIQKFIKSYDFGQKEGIGLLLVAESLNKSRELAKYHFVAVNLATNAILLHEIFEEKPAGIGLRNYWARSFYEVIVEIRDKKYKSWKKEYVAK